MHESSTVDATHRRQRYSTHTLIERDRTLKVAWLRCNVISACGTALHSLDEWRVAEHFDGACVGPRQNRTSLVRAEPAAIRRSTKRRRSQGRYLQGDVQGDVQRTYKAPRMTSAQCACKARAISGRYSDDKKIGRNCGASLRALTCVASEM